MKFAKKSVATLLTGAALALTATHASAFNLATMTTNGQVATVTPGSAYSHNDTVAAKAWADGGSPAGSGWGHTSDWYQFQVTSATGVKIVVSANDANALLHPGFSIWSVNGPVDHSSGAHRYSQVSGPEASGGAHKNQWMNALGAGNPPATSTHVTGFVGYSNGNSNAADSNFTNGAGYAVGTGSAGSSRGSNGGLDWAALDLANLAPGYYIMAVGGSCYTQTNCGTANGTGGWKAGSYNVQINAVPVPGAVWLFASAMLGMLGMKRRQAVAA
ncbi:hypothetical protein [Methylomonas koyamae]|nr:hypothetical protein [Methylomonas koyamae]